MEMNKKAIFSLILGLSVSSLSFASINILKLTPPKNDPLALLILGEIAIDQNQPEVASNNYYELSKVYHDPALLKNAIRISINHKLYPLALKESKAWLLLQPDSTEAFYTASVLQMAQDNHDYDLTYLKRFLQLNTDQELLQNIVVLLENLSPKEKIAFLTAFMKLDPEFKNNPNYLLIKAELLFQIKDFNAADATAQKLLLLNPSSPPASALYAKILTGQHKDLLALYFLKRQTIQYPKESRIQFMYAELLNKLGYTALAITEFKKLSHNEKVKSLALLSLAEIEIKIKHYDTAKFYLQSVIQDPAYQDFAYYYLGNIAILNKDPNEAIQDFDKVNEGISYFPSKIQEAILLAKQGKFAQSKEVLNAIQTSDVSQIRQIIILQVDLLLEKNDTENALNLLNRAIQLLPNDVDLLYARCTVAYKMNRMDIMEADLRTILKIDPNQIDAMDALAYILITEPSHHPEALSLINKALVLDPNNTATLDTMGWLQYHLGNYSLAVVYLTKAYQLNPSPGIAAHLGEALWKNGNRASAISILQTALQNSPNEQQLMDVLTKVKSQP